MKFLYDREFSERFVNSIRQRQRIVIISEFPYEKVSYYSHSHNDSQTRECESSTVFKTSSQNKFGFKTLYSLWFCYLICCSWEVLNNIFFTKPLILFFILDSSFASKYFAFLVAYNMNILNIFTTYVRIKQIKHIWNISYELNKYNNLKKKLWIKVLIKCKVEVL